MCVESIKKVNALCYDASYTVFIIDYINIHESGGILREVICVQTKLAIYTYLILEESIKLPVHISNFTDSIIIDYLKYITNNLLNLICTRGQTIKYLNGIKRE